jgi:hypothetical protein
VNRREAAPQQQEQREGPDAMANQRERSRLPAGRPPSGNIDRDAYAAHDKAVDEFSARGGKIKQIPPASEAHKAETERQRLKRGKRAQDGTRPDRKVRYYGEAQDLDFLNSHPGHHLHKKAGLDHGESPRVDGAGDDRPGDDDDAGGDDGFELTAGDNDDAGGGDGFELDANLEGEGHHTTHASNPSPRDWVRDPTNLRRPGGQSWRPDPWHPGRLIAHDPCDAGGLNAREMRPGWNVTDKLTKLAADSVESLAFYRRKDKIEATITAKVLPKARKIIEKSKTVPPADVDRVVASFRDLLWLKIHQERRRRRFRRL